METKCKRCKAKESIFACMECDKFRFLCGRCDDYIHNLPKNSKHKRVAILQQINPNTSNSMVAQSPNHESITKEDNEHTNLKQPDLIANQSIINQQDSLVNLSTNRAFPQLQSLSNEKSPIDNPFSYSNEYSKSYLNELKSSIKKEKNDLLYQNNALLGMIDKLKESFSDQLKVLATEVGKYQSSNEQAAFSLENRLNVKYANSLNEKEIEISSLKSTISSLEKQNSDISCQLTNALEQFQQKEIEYQRQIKQLEDSLLRKDEDLFMIRGNLDEVVTHSSDKLSFETNAIKISYEKKIQAILNEADKARDGLIKVVEERENDIRSLIDTNRKQREEFNGLVLGIKKENDEYRNKICEVMSQKNQCDEDIRYLSSSNSQIAIKAQENERAMHKMKEDTERLLEENVSIKD